jgi:hypothetical protein
VIRALPRFRVARRAAFAFAFAVATSAAHAQTPPASPASPAAPDPARDALVALLAAPASSAALFSSNAQGATPATVGRYVTFYEKSIGMPTAVVRDGADYVILAPRGALRADLSLDPTGKIDTIRFHDELSPVNADALARVLRATALQTEWFAANPARDAAVARTQKIVDGLHAALGAFVRVETRHGVYVAVFARGETHAQISADNSGRIIYLSFEKP